MPALVKWTDRRFAFDFPAGHYPEIMERLRGTPARVEDRVRSFPPEILTVRVGEAWSIQEHVGHLADLEELFMGRLDDYGSGADALRPADMTNQKTYEARHNEHPLETILRRLRADRRKLVARLESLESSKFEQSIFHPRLKIPMRLVDMMYFQAEHDDYHLARMTELGRTLTKT